MPLFPGTLTDEEMALRVKEWSLVGYVIECAHETPDSNARRVPFNAEEQKDYSFLHVYSPEKPIFFGSLGTLSASYLHGKGDWHYQGAKPWTSLKDSQTKR